MAKSSYILQGKIRMIQTCRRSLLPLLAAALLFAGTAHAQYAWIDAKGIHHYSDQPPPPSAPAAKILQAPRGSSLRAQPDEPAAAPPEAAPAKAQPTLAERDADFNKRAQERDKQEKKGAAEARHRAAVAENCESARQYKAQLESGIRVASTSADGERAFISDEERARQAAKANAVLRDCR
jgi:type IV secretory pathway VirB10-like protein